MLGALVYHNCLGGDFIWDDLGLVKNNIYIRGWSNLPVIFTQNIWSGVGEGSTLYRPLQIATYLLDYSLWNLNPAGYHFTNVLLHILAALTLYWLLCLLFKNQILALFSSLLFVAHPVQVEAVAYIAGRADPLAAIFIFISFAFYLRFLQSKKMLILVMAGLSFILALLSRENALVLPALLLLYHYVFKKKLEPKSFRPFLVIASVYIILRLAFKGTVFYDIPAASTLAQRTPGFLAALASYSRILLQPFNLHMEYGNLYFSWFCPEVLLGAGILLLLFAGILKSRQRQPLVCFSLSWFIITLLPSANLYPINAYMAEHWLYLPSIGFFVIIGQSFAFLYARGRLRLLALAALICLLIFYTDLTIKQNAYWQSEKFFYKRTLFYGPSNARVHNNLGNLYLRSGNIDAAIKEYLRAIEISPGFAYAYRNLGDLYCTIGNPEAGIKMYLMAVRADPRYAPAYNNICNTYISSGRNEEGIKYCQIALGLDNSLASAYYNLSNAYYNLGNKNEAMQMLKESIKYNPFYTEAYNNLAAQYTEKGEISAAIGLWKKCVSIDPDFIVAHFNLAVFYLKLKDYDLAIRHADRVVALGGQIDARFLEELKPFRR